MDENNLVPAYYVVGRNLNDTQINFVEHALRFTPVIAAIYTDYHDNELASLFSSTTLKVIDLDSAHKLAKQIDEPSIIIGETGFHAYYADGHSDTLRS